MFSEREQTLSPFPFVQKFPCAQIPQPGFPSLVTHSSSVPGFLIHFRSKDSGSLDYTQLYLNQLRSDPFIALQRGTKALNCGRRWGQS